MQPKQNRTEKQIRRERLAMWLLVLVIVMSLVTVFAMYVME